MSISSELKEILHDLAEGFGHIKDAIVGKAEDDASQALDKIGSALEDKLEGGLSGLTDRLVDKIKKL